jgi:hypothetical protein
MMKKIILYELWDYIMVEYPLKSATVKINIALKHLSVRGTVCSLVHLFHYFFISQLQLWIYTIKWQDKKGEMN